MRHQCKVCGEEKPIEEFVKHIAAGPLEPWNVRFCKKCSHAKYLARASDPYNKATLQQSSSQWKKNNPEHHARLAREYRARNKEKTLAQNKLNYAIRSGRIKRQPCEVCGSAERVHAHQPEDWYNVKWLCFVCHKMQHTDE
jgi:hypothetical protein